MNMHRALNYSVRPLGVHDVQNGMDRLVAAGPEDRGTQDLPRIGIHHHLHETVRFALLYGARHSGHGTLPYQRPSSRLPHFGLRHPRAAQRQIDVQRIGLNPVADPTWIVIQNIGGDNLIIIV
jgi:hypothetical protein